MPSFTIHAGDWLPALRAMPAGSINAIVTDPPYCSGAATEAHRRHRGAMTFAEDEDWLVADSMSTTAYRAMMRDLGMEAARLLPDGGGLVIFCDWRMTPHVVETVEQSGLRSQSVVVWDKVHNALGNGFRRRHEFALYFTKGTPKPGRRDVGDVIQHPREPNEHHPTQKPVGLMQTIIEVVSHEGDVVADPFMGSGSTGVAALQSGRDFWGAELDARWRTAAEQRLRAAQAQQKLTF